MGAVAREANYDQVSQNHESRCYFANTHRYGVSNIRELLGHKVDLNFIETNPAVRLDKD